MYSDNANNFIGTNNLLKELQMEFSKQQEKLQLFASELGMEWHFIPPRVPHFGGLWEAAVISVASPRPANGQSVVRAHLADVVAILNSRPLTPLSSDPNDGEALTQGSVPDRPNKELTYLRRWQMLSTLRQRFWLAWSKDYIHNLQIHTKWKSPQPGLEVGCLVLVHEDNTLPQRWITGRVAGVTRGTDGQIRVAEIRTGTGKFKRPIHKLARLPVI
ncbi:uncharacterized protein LOC132794954 isoform X2 [Drosophila nasuta]|nr:uncharacterized protein LOC132794954 isoform X2 [Drosophila nasuta]